MARDKIHEEAKQALILEGWTITDDPLKIQVGAKKLEVDLAAERLLIAERGLEKIAVEIKSFLGTSTITDFYGAWGQFALYQRSIAQSEPDRRVYLLLPYDAYYELLEDVFKYPGFTDLNQHLIVLQKDSSLLWIE